MILWNIWLSYCYIVFYALPAIYPSSRFPTGYWVHSLFGNNILNTEWAIFGASYQCFRILRFNQYIMSKGNWNLIWSAVSLCIYPETSLKRIYYSCVIECHLNVYQRVDSNYHYWRRKSLIICLEFEWL